VVDYAAYITAYLTDEEPALGDETSVIRIERGPADRACDFGKRDAADDEAVVQDRKLVHSRGVMHEQA
jgi:hypothetical protein